MEDSFDSSQDSQPTPKTISEPTHSDSLPSPQEQISIMKELTKKSKLTIEDGAYLISQTWINNWRYNMGYYSGEPSNSETGPIDNSELLDNDGEIKSNMREYTNYTILSKSEWNQLFSWYGGGPIIHVPVIIDSYGYTKALISKISLTIMYKDDTWNCRCYDSDTAEKLKSICLEHFFKDGVPSNIEFRLLDYYGKRFHSVLKETSTLKDSRIYDEQEIILDFKDKDDTEWNFKIETHQTSSYNYSYSYYTSPYHPGLVGFQNLGNTCFFNSGTQCLVHNRALMHFFLHEDWKSQLNPTNPISMKGKLATAFHNLIENVWHGNNGIISPTEMKTVIGQFAPQFSGYAQQDSHELITFMLDGIHEDLNRCKVKPYVDAIVGDGTNDDEIARESWERHLKRNDSVIVDHFQAQLKSRLICPNCGKSTVVFDPYLSLSLPIVKQSVKTYSAFFVPFDYMEDWIPIRISLSSKAKKADVNAEVSRVLGRQVNVVIGHCTEYNLQIKFGVPSSNSYYDPVIYCFELDSQAPDDAFYVPCYVKMNAEWYSSTKDAEVAGPFIIRVSSINATEEELSIAAENQLGCIWDQSIQEIPDKEIDKIAKKIDVASSAHQESLYDQTISSQCHELGKVQVTITKNYWETNPSLKTGKYLNCSNTNVELHFTPDGLSKESNFNLKILLRHRKTISLESTSEEGTLTLNKCFELFSAEEKLDENNQWYCPNCKEFVCADKKMMIWSVPECLVLQLKRFTTQSYSSSKIEANVYFPDNLDLTQYVVGPQKENPEQLQYRLCGVSEHMGDIGFGHYTAHVLVCQDGENDGKWYYFNDSSVSESSAEEAHNSSAYVLFYERKQATIE